MPSRLVTLAVTLAAVATVVAGCSDDGDKGVPVAAPSITAPATTGTTPMTAPETTAPPTTAAAGPPTTAAPTGSCPLFTPDLPGSALYCDALPGIADGTVEVPAPEFCLAAAEAPPELVKLTFWGRTAVVRQLADYFDTLVPLAPADMAPSTTAMAEVGRSYLDLLERRDSGALDQVAFDAEFQQWLGTVESEHPDLIPQWLFGVMRTCVPLSD